MVTKAKKNITLIIKNELCMGCGACVAVCPQGAIKIDYPVSYRPALLASKCVLCGLCYDVCPGKGWPAVQWAAAICKDNAVEMNTPKGPAQKFFLGRSKDPSIQHNGASGGIATSLLLYLLEIKEVDAVAVVGLEKGCPVSKITADTEEVLASSGSKYSPVPVMENVLNRLKNYPGKIAMTVIPCHLAALYYAMEQDERIIGKMAYTVGLFCGDLKNYESVYRIAESLGLKYPQDAQFLGWRCGQWPGNARFKLKDGTFKEKPLYSWLNIAIPYYSLQRCLMCPARENWLSDVSLADNHVGATGDTVIVARTKKGYDMLLGAKEKGFIELIELEKIQADKIVTSTKFIPSLSYIDWKRRKGHLVPVYDYDGTSFFSEHSRVFIYHCLLKYRMFALVRRKIILNFIVAHPVLMGKVGRFINKFPNSIPGIRYAVKFVNFLCFFADKLHLRR